MTDSTAASRSDTTPKRFVLATVLCTLLSLTAALAIIHFSPITEMLVNHSAYVLAKPFTELDHYEQIVAQRMLSSKSLITVDALWSMQVSFFQTIVSVLIGLNAAILAVAFFIIKSSSKAEAIKETASRFEEYISGSSFSRLVKRRTKGATDSLNALYEDKLVAMEALTITIEELRTEVSAITTRLSNLDRSEEGNPDGAIITDE
ncbi:hypothetical protein [Maricaulis maris]|uniref:hypothetical protein n=1 Tax=Maricaulis maris TaxID=74318 RepID=UPI003A8F7EB3